MTVADDLLKNDGKKFIEMMEQLAERRMQREEESRMVANGMGHPSMRHGPAEEEDDDGYDEEAEDDDYSDEEDEFDDDEMAILHLRTTINCANRRTGGHVRRAANGRRASYVPNLCGPDV